MRDGQVNAKFENVRFYVAKHLKGTVGLAAAVDESSVASLGLLDTTLLKQTRQSLMTKHHPAKV